MRECHPKSDRRISVEEAVEAVVTRDVERVRMLLPRTGPIVQTPSGCGLTPTEAAAV
jgi:hypothetical protein